MAGEWTAQLSDDLKDNEAFTPFETLSDFANAHLETVGKVTELDGSAKTLEGKVTDLEGRLANSIPKLGENATEEDVAAYRKAIGVPESPESYEFPQIEGEENDPAMVAWAQKVFFESGLSAEQASSIGQHWNAFMVGLVKEREENAAKAEKEADDKLKVDWGADYDKNKELTKRAFVKFGGEDLVAYLEESGAGNHPALIKAFFEIGKAMGEDDSPPGKSKEDEITEGIDYSKSPAPPNNA